MRTLHLRRRTVILLACILAAALVLIGIGIYGLLRGAPDASRTPAHAASAAPLVTPTAPATTPPVIRQDNPVVYARQVAADIFTWSTTGSVTRTGYLNALMRQADPDSPDLDGLYDDLNAYLPTAAQWQQLAAYSTRQSLTIWTAAIPKKAWDQALAEGGSTIPAGTSAVTIDGTRHRSGVWLGKPTRTSDEVSFTVFVTCQPTYSSCKLVRLSALGTPLR
ncbi:hypothetical protein ACFOYW_16695 [Gryllotalpicola reticulitermitis]|uniref:Secreted protein n=1 Tax=Gryllotalpicola reticulitermitis TaxID=1184153 RepID=A0ABV8QCE6_9MICO